MNRFLKNWFYCLVLLAITPTLLRPACLFLSELSLPTIAGMPLSINATGLLILLGIVALLVKTRKTAWLWAFGRWCLRPFSFDRKYSTFMPWWRKAFFLNRWNKGFVVDGVNHLSQKHSVQNVVGVAGVGGGKTSTTVIPSLLKMDGCSFVATDLSGELLDKTGTDLERRGYTVQVFNLMDLAKSHHYNPIQHLRSYSDIASAAHIIVNSSKAVSESSDPFWASGAVKLVRILLTAMRNGGEPEHMTLANLKYLLANFDYGRSDSKIDQLMIKATLDDPETFDEYKSFCRGNEKTVSSFIATADSALAGLHPELSRLTSAPSEIDFAQLRERKTALFVAVKQQDMASYEFIINLFYSHLIAELLSDLQTAKQGLPVYCILDEFGNQTIPNFDVFASTSRKYRIGYMILLQSLQQLDLRYGKDKAATIMDSLAGELYFPGQDINVASKLARRIGRQHKTTDLLGRKREGSEQLMTEDRIVKMRSDRALLFHGSRDPCKLWMTPYFKQAGLAQRTQTPYALTPRPLPDIQYLPLDTPSPLANLDFGADLKETPDDG